MYPHALMMFLPLFTVLKKSATILYLQLDPETVHPKIMTLPTLTISSPIIKEEVNNLNPLQI